MHQKFGAGKKGEGRKKYNPWPIYICQNARHEIGKKEREMEYNSGCRRKRMCRFFLLFLYPFFSSSLFPLLQKCGNPAPDFGAPLFDFFCTSVVLAQWHFPYECALPLWQKNAKRRIFAGGIMTQSEDLTRSRCRQEEEEETCQCADCTRKSIVHSLFSLPPSAASVGIATKCMQCLAGRRPFGTGFDGRINGVC